MRTNEHNTIDQKKHRERWTRVCCQRRVQSRSSAMGTWQVNIGEEKVPILDIVSRNGKNTYITFRTSYCDSRQACKNEKVDEHPPRRGSHGAWGRSEWRQITSVDDDWATGSVKCKGARISDEMRRGKCREARRYNQQKRECAAQWTFDTPKRMILPSADKPFYFCVVKECNHLSRYQGHGEFLRHWSFTHKFHLPFQKMTKRQMVPLKTGVWLVAVIVPSEWRRKALPNWTFWHWTNRQPMMHWSTLQIVE